MWAGNTTSVHPAGQTSGAKAEGLREIPDIRPEPATAPRDHGVLLVEVPDHLVGRRGPTCGRKQAIGEAGRGGVPAHRPSICDSTPRQSASSALREARRAVSPEAVTV